MAALGLALSALAGCAPTPPFWLVAPADPHTQLRSPRYAPVVAGVKDYRVVDPKDWRELNKEVTPKPREGEGGMKHTPGTKM